jgi:hypothetical protein
MLIPLVLDNQPLLAMYKNAKEPLATLLFQ